MPLVVKEMIPVELKRLKPGVHAVGGVAGLHLVVKEEGKRGNWILRVTIAGRRREIGLGAWRVDRAGTSVGVGLADARRLAAADREVIRAGGDPAEIRRAARAALAEAKKPKPTVNEAIDLCYEARKDGFKDAKGARRWKGTLDVHVRPVLGARPVESITTADVATLLAPIWLSQNRTATKVRERIERVCQFAIAKDLVPPGWTNPAEWKVLREHLPSDQHVRAGRQPSVSWCEAPGWYTALTKVPGTGALALRFLALTAVRAGEVLDMTDAELDLDAGMWTIPAIRTKTGDPHRVPLSKQALDLLKVVPRHAGCPFVFPSPTSKAFSNMALSMVMRRMQAAAVERGETGWLDEESKKPAVPHGLRATFRTFAAEHGFDSVLAELALGHRQGTAVTRAYNRTTLVEKRRDLMQAWADYLTTPPEAA